MDKTVFVLGAGFSKNENAPLQAEIIREIFKIKIKDLVPGFRKIYKRYRNDFKRFLSDTMFIDEQHFGNQSLEDIYIRPLTGALSIALLSGISPQGFN